MRINKTTTVGAVAACAVIGATSPVWADSGSGTSDDTAAQQTAVINALKAEIAKLKAEVKADESALHAASKAARAEAHALAKARAEAAHLRSHPATRTVTVPASVATFRRDKADNESFTRSHDGRPCDHAHGDFRDRDDHGDRHDGEGGRHGDWDG